MGDFHLIDIIFILLVLLMILHGYVRGFVTELFSWAAVAASVAAAFFLHAPAAEIIRGNVMPGVLYVPELLAFAAIFILAVMLGKILERILMNIVIGINLGTVDKILGAVFGLAEGAGIVVIILFVMNVQPLFDASAIVGSSVFAQLILPFFSGIPFNIGQDAINTTFWEFRQMEILPPESVSPHLGAIRV